MRKNFLFAAAGTICLMLASCSDDEPIAQNTSESVISYSVVTANQSRAAHSYCANNMPGGFKVWATHNGNIYIDGDDIEKSGDAYIDVTGTRFWPAENPILSFYAVVDGDFGTTPDGVTFDANAKAVKNYTIKDDAKDQLDLMYAVKKDATYDAAHPIELNFRHALSQICFKARSESTTNRITVNSISVGGLCYKGTYALPSESTTSNINDHSEPPTTVDNRSHGEWTLMSDKTSYTISFPGIELDATAKNLTGGKIGDHTNTTGVDWTDVLTLMPQKLDKSSVDSKAEADPTDGAYFKLNLTINNVGKDNVYEEVGTVDLYLGANIDWEEGYRYIYTFNFGKDLSLLNLNDIEYTVTCDDFIEKEIEINPIINGHEAVMMREATDAEPALYVATKNIGAERLTDYGRYFWWGDTEGQPYGNPGNLDIFSNGSDVVITDGLDLAADPNGWVTGGILNPEKDAAVQLWGGTWRMPTQDELIWLQKNCTWKEVKDENDKRLGVRIVSKTTGGEIYLPAAACYQKGNVSYEPGDGKQFDHVCFYWSSTVSHASHEGSNKHAFRLKFAGSINISDAGLRYDGFPIRPVANTKQ